VYNDAVKDKKLKVLAWEEKEKSLQVVLDVEVPLNDIPTSSLQFCLWSSKLKQLQKK
jgi:hypothetical protein